MEAHEVDQAMAELRLRRELERHIEAVEEPPEEVREAVLGLFPDRANPS